ncbi:MAG: FMN-binding negative transcriptional regulator, partial [Rhodospirillaceae bacterium]|nr:FMN-binding negative transcriptional regulator [Rhodospirillaceae bacterium]
TERQTRLDSTREAGWGYWTGSGKGDPFVTHLPLLVEGEDGNEKLVAHMARANPHWKSFADGTEQLVVFPGPHGYISPSWYETKKAVPTWNYAAAHAYGIPQIIDDPDAVYAGQKKLVDHHEAQFDTPWAMESVEAEFIEGMLRAIVCFEIPVQRIECKFKLSQNRTEQDRTNVIDALTHSEDLGGQVVAKMMKRSRPESAG